MQYYSDEHKLIQTRYSSKETAPSGTRRPKQHDKTQIEWLKLPWVTWFLSTVCVGVFIAELAIMKQLTGSAFQTKPSFNPMLGPSPYVLIHMGSRYDACMRPSNASNYVFPCPNSTTSDTVVCSIDELCGHNLDAGWQWWRYITAMFLHAGFVHIGLNLALMLMLGHTLERQLGHVRLLLIFFLCGIGGFLMSANFAGSGTSSAGASGACFGLIAIELVDLLLNWKLYHHPWYNLVIHIVEAVVSFVIGLLPGLDNFAHIGGFCIGILTGVIVMHSPLKFRVKNNPNPRRKFDVVKFDLKSPFKGLGDRTRLWWAWCGVRVAAFAILLVYYVLLIKGFQDNTTHCSWCRYLSCLPVNGWCDASYQGI